jgi:hypothetical protein
MDVHATSSHFLVPANIDTCTDKNRLSGGSNRLHCLFLKKVSCHGAVFQHSDHVVGNLLAVIVLIRGSHLIGHLDGRPIQRCSRNARRWAANKARGASAPEPPGNGDSASLRSFDAEGDE